MDGERIEYPAAVAWLDPSQQVPQRDGVAPPRPREHLVERTLAVSAFPEVHQ